MKTFVMPLVLVALTVVAFYAIKNTKPVPEEKREVVASEESNAFDLPDFKTNTSIISIDSDEILSGGPGKDGIPSIDNPSFISVTEAAQIEPLEAEGLSVVIDDVARFYPYTILVWHEIVNDVFGKKPVAITFCPLCGSGIVFDRILDGEILTFGVSGYLWESNLLMFDRENESLWSQAKGEAVAGDATGTKLEVIHSDLISFEEFKSTYPDGQVLSRDTGHIRAYGFYPYGDYEENDDYIFPVSNTDTRFDGKELMYVVVSGDESIAFPRAALLEAGSAEVISESGIVKAEVDGSKITVTDSSGNALPGYHEMWFSWATHNGENGLVWEQ